MYSRKHHLIGLQRPALSDILQSLALALGPLLVPSSAPFHHSEFGQSVTIIHVKWTIDLSGAYGGSQSFGTNNVAYRSEREWCHNVGDDASVSSGLIVEEEEGMQRRQKEHLTEELHTTSKTENDKVEEEAQQTPFVDTSRAFARAAGRVNPCEM